MVKAELGVKRICTSCAVRFYDLMRSPAICPKCGASVETAATIKPKRGKAHESKPIIDEDAATEADGFIDASDLLDLDDDDSDADVVPQKATKAEDESEASIPNFADDPLIDDEEELEDGDDILETPFKKDTDDA